MNLSKIQEELHKDAKAWSVGTLGFRLLIYMTGSIAIFGYIGERWVPFILPFFALLSEITKWFSDNNKQSAEKFLRLLELNDGFGFALPKKEIGDRLANLPDRYRKLIQTDIDPYFGASHDVGVLRSMRNLEESAWWSKHVAQTSGRVYLAVTIFVVVLSIVALMISTSVLNGGPSAEKTVRVVTSTLMLLFSTTLLRSTISYFRFSSAAKSAEGKAAQFVISNSSDNALALVTLFDYQSARGSAPLLPNLIYRFRRNKLNSLWELR